MSEKIVSLEGREGYIVALRGKETTEVLIDGTANQIMNTLSSAIEAVLIELDGMGHSRAVAARAVIQALDEAVGHLSKNKAEKENEE